MRCPITLSGVICLSLMLLPACGPQAERQAERVAGDFAIIWTNYTVTLTPKGDGEPFESDGKWLKVLKRQSDGSWKFSRNFLEQRQSTT